MVTPEEGASYELRMLRSGVDVWKNGGMDVLCLHTSHTRIPQADSVSAAGNLPAVPEAHRRLGVWAFSGLLYSCELGRVATIIQ